MDHPAMITMSMRELDRLKVAEAVVEQRLIRFCRGKGKMVNKRQYK
ncbi:hypothetical protein [Paraburkholderia sp. MM5477-R1]